MSRHEARNEIIRRICNDIVSMGHDVGPMPETVDTEKLDQLTEILTRGKVSDFKGFSGRILGETDFGVIMGNVDDAARRMQIVEKLSEVGVIPKVTMKDGNSISGAFSDIMETDKGLYYLLNEIADQGMKQVNEIAFGEDTRTLDEIVESSNERVRSKVEKAGFIISREVDPVRVSEATEEDLRDILQATDTKVGFTSMQNAVLMVAQPGVQGIMRSLFNERKIKNALKALSDAGLTPTIEVKPYEPPAGAGFIERMKAATKHMMETPHAGFQSALLIATGREIVRSRIEDIIIENSLDKEPTM